MSERLCVVMPVYNEQEAIGPVLEKWDAALKALGIDYEIRPYNDGSKDNSLAVMREVAEKLTGVKVKDKVNGGHGNTILTGYREAAADGFEWVFQIDSDDEMGPEKFNVLWSRRNDYDFLVGIRDGRVQALPRKIISLVSRICVRIFYGKSVWDVNTPYRLMRVSAFKDFYARIPLTTFAPNVILSGLAARHKLRCFETRVPQHDRTTGEVSIKKWKLLKAAVRSFGQTIWFALWGAYQDNSWIEKSARLCIGVICLWGILFCIFRISNPPVLICAFMVLVILSLSKYRACFSNIDTVAKWCAAHWRICLVSVIFIALVERLFVCAVLAHGDIASFQAGDSPLFWREALEMANGMFPETKSWVTVGIYSVLIKLFGNCLMPAVCLNVGFQILTALLLFCLARRHFGVLAGLGTCAFYVLAPSFASFSIRIYSEHFAHFFIVLELLLLSNLPKEEGLYGIVRLIGIGCLLPILLWTRAEAGCIMAAIVAIVLLWQLFIYSGRSWKRVVSAGLVITAVVGCILFAGFNLNVRYHGIRTPLCSNDNLWPRLFGSNYYYAGEVNPFDVSLICKRYAEQNGLVSPVMPRPNTCPAEFAPLIKEEIAHRWREMTCSQLFKLVCKKEIRTWTVKAWAIHFNRLWYGADCIFNVILSFCSILGLWSIFRVSQKDGKLPRGLVHVLLPILYIMAVFAVVFIVEGNNKYGIIA